MIRTFKVLSLLLSYPTQDMINAAESMRCILRDEGLLSNKRLRDAEQLIDDFATLDIFDLQERYVFLFDRTRSLSLHLFEHVHGESRDRGQAMVDLKSLYAAAGLQAGDRELPDFLPLFLEYLSLIDIDRARELLGEPITVIVALRERLEKRGSVYAGVLRALEAAAASKAPADALRDLRNAPDDDPLDLEALDAAWEDRPVLFGADAAGCPKAEDMMRRMRDENSSNSARS